MSQGIFTCLQILPQDLLKKYITYAKLNVFPRFNDVDLDKLTHVYAELRKESSVMFCLFFLFLSNTLLFVVIDCVGFTNKLHLFSCLAWSRSPHCCKAH